tara:strand:+ start:786 stop:1976 length:1191 start_codon:yes stop_codon:yes gene_type:complete
MPQAKLVAFDRRDNPQSRFNVPGLPKTTQLISKTEFELQIKKLAKSVSLPVDRALDISFKHPHEFNTEDVDSALFHKQLWDSLHEQREQQKDSLLAEIEAKKTENTQEETLGSLVKIYLETIDTEVSVRRLELLQQITGQFLDHFGADTLVSDFDGDMTAFRNKIKHSLAKNTLVLRIAGLKAFTRHYSVSKHFKGKDFVWGCCKKVKPEKQPFSDKELEAILAGVSSNNHERYYYFALYAGFRAEEIQNIQLKHFFLEGSEQMPEPHILIPKQKSGRKNQRYPLLPQLVEFLKRDLSRRSSREVYFLDNSFGKQAWETRHGLSQAIKQMIVKAGVEGKSAHTFRHTFCNKILLQTKDIYLVSKAMRHSCVQVTEEYLSEEIQELGIAERLTKITF